MSKSWQESKERSTPFTLRFIFWVALHLGRPVARAFLYPITLYFLFFAVSQRKASQQYLARVLKRKVSWMDNARHIHTFAATILDRIYLLTGQFSKFDISFPAENLHAKHCKINSGCLLLGSHIGSFEVLRSYSVYNHDENFKILMHERQAPMILEMFNALNADIADTLITLNDTPASLLKVKEAIDNGITVGLLGDRIMSNSDKTVSCTLLGETVQISTMPILLAATLKVPIIVFFGIYLGGNRYQVRSRLLAEKVILNRKTRQQDIQAYAQNYVDILEKQILEAPYNWFNFYDYWQQDE